MDRHSSEAHSRQCEQLLIVLLWSGSGSDNMIVGYGRVSTNGQTLDTQTLIVTALIGLARSTKDLLNILVLS
jgi:DNA invertase Pin-like site-specific DNA recombinase